MSRNAIRRSNEVGGSQLLPFLVGAGIATALVVAFLVLHNTNIRASAELKKLEIAQTQLEDLVKTSLLEAERLRSPRLLSERSAQMNLGLVSVSQLEFVETPVRRSWRGADLAREETR